MNNPFDVIFDPNILPVPTPEPPKIKELTIGEMSQADFARNMYMLMNVILSQYETAQKNEVIPVYPGNSGGGTTDGVLLLD